ncbi:MAG: biotin/lipoyl-binding protein, partial [Beijerinckiaceae bacterium]
MSNAPSCSPDYVRSLRRSFFAGAATLALFGGTLGLWAATAPLSGAVLASGHFVVDSNVKKVQHQHGGVVSELLVREGELVKAGDLLIRLDETITAANLGIIVKQLDELMTRGARLEAERSGRDEIAVPPELASRASDSGVARSLADEQRLHVVRRSQRDGQKSQLVKRIDQLQEEIQGVAAQTRSREQQIKLLSQELEGVRNLYKRNLVPITRLMPLEREAANMLGQRG